MKIQLPERLVPIIEQAGRLGLHSDKGSSVGRQQRKFQYCPTFVAICSMLFCDIDLLQFQM
jgi:hypothetical protein